MAVQQKTNLHSFENAQRRTIRAMFFQKKSEMLLKIIADKNFLTVYEMYISELIVELIRQLRENSPFDLMRIILTSIYVIYVESQNVY